MPIDLTQSVLVGMQGMQETSRRKFGYEAAEDSHRRKSTAAVISSEDDVLDASRRRKLQANGLDIQRNFAIAAWAIRKHLDFVTSFSFSSNNAQEVLGDDSTEATALQAERSQLDDDIEGVVTEASAADNCDTAGRHSLDMMLRLCEARATVAGDHCFLEVDDGTMQAIESDRVLTPQGDKEGVVHGVRLDKRGRSLAYAVHGRKGTGYTFERWVPAASTVWRGYYDRFDQVRGISPMAPALNPLRDLHEGFVYALAKAKIAQLFGFKVNHTGETGIAETINTDAERKKYAIELGKGPWNIDLDPGDDINIMTADVPGSGFESFSEMMIAISLLAIDLPWNFYKVDATNFFGSRAALNLYLKSVKTKRQANQTILRRWTRRQIQFAIVRGKLRLPRTLTVDDLRYSWTPDGMPWWNPSQEADGALKSIGGALDNPQDICLATGTNVFRNIDRISEVQKYAETKGVKLSYAVPAAINIQPAQ